ncbi:MULTISPECIES: hypothetical protein [unclassified Mycobacterium]|uniref:hypothetical protein n=1 Tax=unclassified Mycobacterium TaxID=2642494 RepID=UPI00128D95FF|nr:MULTISPECIES: hypothetical protein [unclassified Mycobacterium]
MRRRTDAYLAPAGSCRAGADRAGPNRSRASRADAGGADNAAGPDGTPDTDAGRSDRSDERVWVYAAGLALICLGVEVHAVAAAV